MPVVVGQDDGGRAETAGAPAGALPHGRHVPVPGDHLSALAGPTLHTAIARFLADHDDV